MPNVENAGNIIRDESGVPVEWTLLKIGENPLIRAGEPGNIVLTEEGMSSILHYFRKKGELIPVDSNHYLHALAERKHAEESDVLKMLPSGVAAMGFGSLFRSGDDLRIRVKWTPLAHEFLQEKIFKYFSPVIRGLQNPPLRITSVAMENEPAINNLDALAASAENNHSSAQKAESTQERKENTMEQNKEIPESCRPEETAEKEPLSVLKELLQLEEDADLDIVFLTIRTMQEKATEADRLNHELEKVHEELTLLQQEAETRNRNDLLEQGIREGKITPATRAWWEKLDTVQLSAHLPQAPVLIRQGAMERTRLASDTEPLTAEDRAACRRFGFSENEYLCCKKKLK